MPCLASVDRERHRPVVLAGIVGSVDRDLAGDV